MLSSAIRLEKFRKSNARSCTLSTMVQSCRRIAVLLERARKQAALGRPRAAIDAVEEARACLTAPLGSLMRGPGVGGVGGGVGGIGGGGNEILMELQMKWEADKALLVSTSTSLSGPAAGGAGGGMGEGGATAGPNATTTSSAGAGVATTSAKTTTVLRLEDTPFGSQAIQMLPKIENEVLMGARRGLNRWFLSLRSGGDGAKAGRAALRRCAMSVAIGPGQLGLGGKIQSYAWRAKNADNLISRASQHGKVARAARSGYWFERDCQREATRLEGCPGGMGLGRRAEALASAFGWYRCWDEEGGSGEELQLILSTDWNNPDGSGKGMDGSGHSAHGGGASAMNRSGHGRSLGFKASHRGGGTSADLVMASSKRSGAGGSGKRSQWAEVLTPSILAHNANPK